MTVSLGEGVVSGFSLDAELTCPGRRQSKACDLPHSLFLSFDERTASGLTDSSDAIHPWSKCPFRSRRGSSAAVRLSSENPPTLRRQPKTATRRHLKTYGWLTDVAVIQNGRRRSLGVISVQYPAYGRSQQSHEVLPDPPIPQTCLDDIRKTRS